MLRIAKAAVLYFALVFGAGFLLAMVRIPLLVPRLGTRWAELLEMPAMLLVIVLSARYVVQRFGPLRLAARAAIGIAALLLLAVAELAVAGVLQGQSPAQYVASRDAVSGGAYLGMLLLFAVMPTFRRAGA